MATAKTAEAKSLAAKLSEVMAEMGAIKKGGYNKNQKYAFVRESDVAERASALLSERKIWIHQTVVESSHEPLYVTSSGMQMFISTVAMDFIFIDGETGEKTEPLRFVGHGADSGDKGIYKAMTGAEKYFLMKTFLISTGDDPEGDEKVDAAAAGAAAGKGSRVKGKASTTAQKGGKTDAITGAQMKEIVRLIGEKGITADGYLAVVAMTVDVPEGSDANVITKGLKATQAAEVIKALGELSEAEDVPDEDLVDVASGGNSDEQEGMSIV